MSFDKSIPREFHFDTFGRFKGLDEAQICLVFSGKDEPLQVVKNNIGTRHECMIFFHFKVKNLSTFYGEREILVA